MSLISNYVYLGVNSSSAKIRIGEVIPVITNKVNGVTPNTTLAGGFVRTDSVQLKSEYPELAAKLGTIPIIQRPIVTNLTAVNSGTTTDILASTYGNGRYVASLANGNLITSTDRINWTNVSLSALNLTDPITSLAYGNGQYIGGGNRGTLISSTNGTTWQTRSLGSANNVGFVAYANGLYFVGGNSTPGFIRSSTNLTTWSNNLFDTSGYLSSTFTFKTMTYGNNMYMVGAQNGWTFSSSNTTNWVYQGGLSGGCYSIAYGETSNGVNNMNVFIAVTSPYERYIQPQSQGSYRGYIYSWMANQGWQQRKQSDGNAGYFSAVYANNQFIVSGGASYPYELSYGSTDGINFFVRDNLSDPSIIINTMTVDGQNNIVEFGDFGHISSYRMYKSTSLPFFYDSNTHFYVPPYDPNIIGLRSGYQFTPLSNSRDFSNNDIAVVEKTYYMKGTYDTNVPGFPEGGVFQSLIVNKGYNDSGEIAYGKLVKANSVYSQSDYPDLFRQIGYVRASHFQQIETVNTVMTQANSSNLVSIAGLSYGNNTYAFLANSTNQITTLVFTSNNLQQWSNTTFLHPSESNASYWPKFLTYGNEKFALAGTAGVYATSTDARDWYPKIIRHSGTTSVYSMVYGNGIYILGLTGTPNILTSTDLVTWTTRSILNTTWYAAFYNNGLYMLGGGNVVYTSNNSITWDARTCSGVGTILKISYANGLYLAGGDTGFATSTDAITWTTRSLGTGQTSAYSHATGNGVYMIGDSSGRIKTSTDLITWDTRTSNTTQHIYRMTYGNGTFVLTDGSVGSIRTSIDNGITWTERDSRNGRGLIFSLDYSNGIFYYSDQSGYLSTSTDAINWNTTYNSRNAFAYYNSFLSTELNSIFYVGAGQGTINQYRLGELETGNIYHPRPSFPADTYVSNFKYQNGTYYISGFTGGRSSPFFGTSTNLIKWEMTPAANVANTNFNSNWYTGTYGGGQFVIAGDSGQLRTSTHPEAQIWQTRSTQGGETIVRVKHINGLYITGGSSGIVRTSTDAITWTQRTSGTTQTIRDFAYGQSRYFFVAEGGAIQSTTNFVTWETRTSGSTSGIYSIVYNNGLFVSSSYNKVITSNDGVTWTTRTMNLDGSGQVWYYKVMYGNGIYVAAGDSGYIKTSTDAVTWNIRPSGIYHTFYGGEYSNGRFYLLEQYTSDRYRYDLVTSTDGINWSNRYVGIPDRYRYYYDIFRGNGRHIVLGQNGYAASFKEDFFLPTPNSIFDMGNAGGRTYFVGANGVISTSTNGNLFDRRASKANTFFVGGTGNQTNINTITYGLGKYVAAGSGGLIRTSTDAINWTVTKSNTTNNIFSVAYGNGTFVYTSINGQIRSSTDSINWNYSINGEILKTNVQSASIFFANNIFLYAGSDRYFAISTNPSNYTYSTLYNPQTEFFVPDVNTFLNFSSTPSSQSSVEIVNYIGTGK